MNIAKVVGITSLFPKAYLYTQGDKLEWRFSQFRVQALACPGFLFKYTHASVPERNVAGTRS